jgi:hypothetical protein
MHAPSKAQSLPTVGVIAAEEGVPVHAVEYVIRTRGIEPSGWAGNARVYAGAEVARIKSELRRIQREKEAAL